jgi:hypothetical protein
MDLKKYPISVGMIAIVAVVLIGIVIMGLVSYFSSTSDKKFPPWISICPDYWTKDQGVCKRSMLPANANGNQKSDDEYNNTDLDYGTTDDGQIRGAALQKFSWVEKCNWAKKNNIFWEGVSDVACVEDSFQYY